MFMVSRALCSIKQDHSAPTSFRFVQTSWSDVDGILSYNILILNVFLERCKAKFQFSTPISVSLTYISHGVVIFSELLKHKLHKTKLFKIKKLPVPLFHAKVSILLSKIARTLSAKTIPRSVNRLMANWGLMLLYIILTVYFNLIYKKRRDYYLLSTVYREPLLL